MSDIVTTEAVTEVSQQSETTQDAAPVQSEGDATTQEATPTEQPVERSFLPTELRDHEAFKDVKSPKDIYKGYMDAKERLGRSVVLPGEEATDEDRETFFKALGRPDSPDGYDLAQPENMPEGHAIKDEFLSEYREAAHKLGLSATQAQKLFGWFGDLAVRNIAANAAQQAQQKADSIEQLKGEWGKDYDRKSELMARAIERFGGKDLREILNAHPAVGNNPLVAGAFAQIGEALSEDSFVEGEPAAPQEDPLDRLYPSMKGM